MVNEVRRPDRGRHSRLAAARHSPASAGEAATARKLQDALPDTVDLLGIVLGTGLALDQAMMRVS